MKKAILFFFLLPLISFTQNGESPVPVLASKHEIGVNIFSANRFERFQDYSDREMTAMDVNVFTGLYYKNHFGKNAWRGSADFTHKVVRNGEILVVPYSTQYYFSNRKNLSIAIGYERSFGSRKVQPYVFSDLVLNYENQTGSRMNIGCFGPYGIVDFSEEIFEYGASLGAGLRYQIRRVLSISYEFNAEGFVSVYQDVLNAGEKYGDVGFHVNPVNRFGLAVSFQGGTR